MLDFLKDCGIKQEIIDYLENKLFENTQYCINCNEIEIKKIIKYFRSIGIKCIDDIILNNLDLFLLTSLEIEEKFNKYDIPRLVELINNNYEVIYQI